MSSLPGYPGVGKLIDMKLDIPEPLYHGSYYDFNEFDDRFRRSNTEWDNTIHGFFFADKVENALLFGPRIYTVMVSIQKPLDLRIHGIFTNLEQAPLLCDVLFDRKFHSKVAALSMLDREIGLGEVAEMFDMFNSEDAKSRFRSAGYDGIISNLGDSQNEYVAFNISQIKIMNMENYGEERHQAEARERRRNF